MKLLLLVINTVITFLIGIGDFVIFCLLVVLKLFKKVHNFAKSFYSGTKKNYNSSIRNIRSGFNFQKKKIKNYFSLLAFKIFIFVKKIRHRLFLKKGKKILAKKEKKENLVTVYPKPKQFKLKIKFFVLGFLFCTVFVLLPFSVYVFLNSLPNPKQLSEREIPQTKIELWFRLILFQKI